ncbi:MAG: alginate export family protein [Ginsengibacter sp.]
MNKYINVFSLVLFILILTLSASSVTAQDEKPEELILNLQLRPRAEMRNGLFTPILEGQKSAFFIAQRSRIKLTYSKNKILKLGLSTQVINTWGNDPQVQTTANNVSLYEAWAQLYFSPEWYVKLGRQVLSYDDERILGALDWNNAARKHDAALLGFEKNKIKANVVVAYNQNSEKVTNTFYDNSLSQPYKGMEFLWLRYDISNALAFSFLGMNLDFQDRIDSSISHLQTIGGNVFFKKDKLRVTGTYYFQAGKKPVKILPDVKTNAWMSALKIDYIFNKRFNAVVGSDYLSGNNMNSTSTTVNYFNPLYGTGHKFYGSMDYFYVSSAHSNAGLWDSYLNFNFNPTEKFAGQVALHHFESTGKIIGYTGANASKSLGNEVDLSFGYNVMSDVKLTGGYSQMFTDESMKYVKNITSAQTMKPVQNWVWISFNFNPQIILKSNK